MNTISPMAALKPAPRATIRINKQMLRLSSYFCLLALDCASIVIGFVCGAQVRGDAWMGADGLQVGVVLLPLYILMALKSKAYSMVALRSAAEGIRRSLSALATTFVMVILFVFFGKVGDDLSRLALAVTGGSAAVSIIVARYCFTRFFAIGGVESLVEEVLVLDGVSLPAPATGRVLDLAAFGVLPKLLDPIAMALLSEQFLGADRVIVACPAERRHDWSILLKSMNIIGEIIVSQSDEVGAVGVSRFAGHETVVVARGPLDISSRAKKRAVDLIFAGAAIIFFAPLLIAVAVAIKLDSPGPVFFRQPRVGRDSRLFNIIKFRSMRVEQCDANGNRSTAQDDDRITRVGRFIRKTSIDELPQLFNVLWGDMSLVGPRPHALGSLAGDKLFWEVNERYWMRHAIKPGITGLAQIRGFRGATDYQEDLQKRLQADLEYVNGWRLWRDVVIAFATLKVIVHPKAY